MKSGLDAKPLFLQVDMLKHIESLEIWKQQMIEKRVHSLWKSDDQERTQFLKMGVKEWAHSFYL